MEKPEVCSMNEDMGEVPQSPLSPQELIAWRSFTRGNVFLIEQLNQDMEQGCGLTLNEYEVLCAVNDSPTKRLRMSTLASDLMHSRSRLTHTVHRLEKMGFVERTRCPDDKRGIFCQLTEEGIEKLGASEATHVAAIRARVCSRLKPQELEEFGRLYRKLLDWDEQDAIPKYDMSQYQCA